MTTIQSVKAQKALDAIKVGNTNLSARVPMVIRIKIMLGHLLRILFTDFILAHFLADAWVD